MGWDRREFIREGLSVPNPSSKGSFLAARWFLSCSEHWSADGATVLLKAGCRTSRLSSQGGCPMGTKASSSGLSTQHSEQVEWWKHMGLSSWILWFREGRKALGPDSPLPPFCSRLSVFIRTISGSQHSWGCGTGHLPAPKGTRMRKPQEKEEFQARLHRQKTAVCLKQNVGQHFPKEAGTVPWTEKTTTRAWASWFFHLHTMGGVQVQLVQSLRVLSQAKSWLFSWGQTYAPRNKPGRTEPTKGRSKTAASWQRKERSQRYRMKNSAIVYHCGCNAGGWGTLPGILRSSWDPDPPQDPCTICKALWPNT